MKQTDITQLSKSDLLERINEEKAALSKLKMNHDVSTIENPLKITLSRKTVARLKTEIRRREIAEAKQN